MAQFSRSCRHVMSNAGHRHQPLAGRILTSQGGDLGRYALDPLVKPMPVGGELLDDAHHARRQHISALGKDDRQCRAQEAHPLAHRNAALQQEGTNLIDDAGALADQAFAHPVQRLQVELLGRLGGNEFHRRTLDRFGDGFGILEVILLSLGIGTHVFRRHEPCLMTE